MEFALIFQQPRNTYEVPADSLKAQEVSLAWKQYMGAMAAAGIMRTGSQLDPLHSHTVRVRNGQPLVQEGPAPDAYSLPGGFMVIDVNTLEEALHWAGRSPASSAGYTEVIAVVPAAR